MATEIKEVIPVSWGVVVSYTLPNKPEVKLWKSERYVYGEGKLNYNTTLDRIKKDIGIGQHIQI